MQKAHSTSQRTPEPTYFTLFSSALGTIGLAATRQGLYWISLGETGTSSFRKKIQNRYGVTAIRRDDLFKESAAQIRAYFSGRAVQFKARIDLREGTAFQRRIWQTLRRIPYGQTRSYGSIAQSIGCPKGSRAVGGACGRNPLPIIVPCHRVVGSNGQLGGFTGGIRLKKRLLALEDAKPFRNRKSRMPAARTV